MKLLLYCTKAKPYLYKTEDTTYPAYPIGYHTDKNLKVKLSNTNELANLNGKIVAECDFEVEEITYELYGDLDWQHDYLPTTNTMGICNLENASCLDRDEIENYLKGNEGYAIHIKNLNIFYTPKELSEYYTKKKNNVEKDEDLFMDGILHTPIKSAPQNMMYAKQLLREDKILISIQPQWLCKILNGEKTIEVRKKVLKEMLNNE